VRLNRKNIPEDMKTQKLKKGETMALYIHKTVSLKWHGQKLVSLLSTVHYKVGITNTDKKKGGKCGELIVKAEVVIAYNRRIVGVDKMYQQLASFLILMRRCVKA
jgi:hypothetical protein